MLLPQHSYFLSSERCTVNAQQNGWEQEGDREQQRQRKEERVNKREIKKIPYERRVAHNINLSLNTIGIKKKSQRNHLVSFLNFQHTDEKKNKINFIFAKGIPGKYFAYLSL